MTSRSSIQWVDVAVGAAAIAGMIGVAMWASAARAEERQGAIPITCYTDDMLDEGVKFEPLVTDGAGRVWGIMSLKSETPMIVVRKEGATCFVTEMPAAT